MPRAPLPPLATPAFAPCKICGGAAPVCGEVDFNKNCEARQGLALPSAGIAIAYNRCKSCGFLFTRAFDAWTHDDFRAAIYNDEYAAVDPEYAAVRPANSASTIEQFFGGDRATLSVLDYGGGNGSLACLLQGLGFGTVRTYDPFTPAYAELPRTRFDLVCCFETLEHVPDPLAAIGRIAGLVGAPGVVLFSTLVQPPEFESIGLDWWYAAPRNGHVSIFSSTALGTAWGRHGFHVVSFNRSLHLAFREIPPFGRHLLRAIAA